MKKDVLILQTILISILFLSPKHLLSQKFIESYYRYDWTETLNHNDSNFYSYLQNTDSGWYRNDFFLNAKKNKIQMIGLYEDKECKMRNGTFRWYYYSGQLKTFGKYIHGQKNGLWLDWYSNGFIKDSLNFKNGNYWGISLSWYKNGYTKDSLNMSENGDGTYVAWFDNGNISEAGRFKEFRKTGKWVYYHMNGKISSIELYNKDSLKQFQLFDEEGIPQDDSITVYKEAVFSKGTKGWKNYLGNTLHFPENVEIQNSDHVFVQIEATINELGNIEDAEVVIPFHPIIDAEALRVIKQSPKWLPAISHNRKVKSEFPFVVRFSQNFD